MSSYQGEKIVESKKKVLSAPLFCAVAACLCFVVFVIVDYFNIPTLLGIHIDNINYDILSIVSGVFIALQVFILTYYLIEQRDVKRQNNQRSIAIYLLRQVYENCKKHTAWLITGVTLDALVEKTDFNSPYDPNGMVGKYSEMAFKNESIILQFASDGVLSSAELQTYFQIKNDFQQYVNLSVVFFDHPEKVYPTKDKLFDDLNSALSCLSDDQAK